MLNVYFQIWEDVFKVLMMIVGMFDLMVYYGFGVIGIVQDVLVDKVKLFLVVNVINGEFFYQGIDKKVCFMVCLVMWFDFVDYCCQKVEVCQVDFEDIVCYGVVMKEIVVYGCILCGQVCCVGNCEIYILLNEIEVVLFQMGMQVVMVWSGEICEIVDLFCVGKCFGGIIKGVIVSVVELDGLV